MAKTVKLFADEQGATKRYVDVTIDEKGDVLLALLERVYAGRFSAVDEFRKDMQAKDIPNEFGSWV